MAHRTSLACEDNLSIKADFHARLLKPGVASYATDAVAAHALPTRADPLPRRPRSLVGCGCLRSLERRHFGHGLRVLHEEGRPCAVVAAASRSPRSRLHCRSGSVTCVKPGTRVDTPNTITACWCGHPTDFSTARSVTGGVAFRPAEPPRHCPSTRRRRPFPARDPRSTWYSPPVRRLVPTTLVLVGWNHSSAVLADHEKGPANLETDFETLRAR